MTEQTITLFSLLGCSLAWVSAEMKAATLSSIFSLMKISDLVSGLLKILLENLLTSTPYYLVSFIRRNHTAILSKSCQVKPCGIGMAAPQNVM